MFDYSSYLRKLTTILVVFAILFSSSATPAFADSKITFRQCGTELQQRITAAHQAMRFRAIQEKDKLIDCMDRAYLVEHDRRSPEKIVSYLTRARTTKYRCRNLDDANASAHRIYREAGVMKVDRDFVRNNSRLRVASVLAHELMHNNGLNHSKNDKGSTLYPNTVPEQIESCVATLQPNPYEGVGRDYYAPEHMVGFGLDGDNNYVFAWSDDGTVTAGSSTRIHNYRHPYNYLIAPGVKRSDIVGMGLDGENNTVYTWLRDGRVIAGSSNNLDRTRSPYRYSLPRGYSPNDIVGMGVDGENNYNFAWYRNGMVSAGTSNDLDKFRAPYRYTLPPGYAPTDIVGMAIDGEANMIFAFYRDGKVSAGTSDNLDRYRAPAQVITGR
ncbi:MAG: hypothetical protein AAF572_14335 [Cyanobacteria bacterium P01_B01_bin.77]